MEELKVYIRSVLLLEYRNNKNAHKQSTKFLLFLAKLILLIAKPETGFQSFPLETVYREMTQIMEARQTSVKMP